MANYYNVTGYKHTYFDTMNRPYSRAVLENSGIETIYMQGIAVKRNDMRSITYIDLPGSVKDVKGTQQNAPNSIGSHGPNGPFYNWEEVDYLRLTRTGYPGDEDFIDITNNMTDPWNATKTAEQKQLRVGYYFVTSIEPLARNITRLSLLFDAWTSCGASDELIIDTGYKVRGHITDAEDAASYNMTAEGIGNIYPLEVTAEANVSLPKHTADPYHIICSNVDLTQYTNEDSITGIVATATGGQEIVIPKIASVATPTAVTLSTGLTLSKTTNVNTYGFFRGDDVAGDTYKALTVLYSANVLDINASYLVPQEYVDIGQSDIRITAIKSKTGTVTNPNAREAMSYPRKADYLYGQEVLMSNASNDMNVQSFSELTDRDIQIWSLPTPNGNPVARFKGIKGHTHDLDQAVNGLPWQNNQVLIEGSAGEFWTKTAAYQTKASLLLSGASASMDTANTNSALRGQIVSQTIGSLVGTGVGMYAGSKAGYHLAGVTGADIASQPFFQGTVTPQGYQMSMSNGATLSAAGAMGVGATAVLNSYAGKLSNDATIQAAASNEAFTQMSLTQQQTQNITNTIQSSLQVPLAGFQPDWNNNMLTDNDFKVYTINTGSKDRARLKRFFKRYGYSGLYEPLTYSNINVKQKVNYIQAEGVALRHKYYAKRDLFDIQTMFAAGVFLWNVPVAESAFDNNPDN